MCACDGFHECRRCKCDNQRYLDYQFDPVENEAEREERLTQEAQTFVVHDRNATA